LLKVKPDIRLAFFIVAAYSARVEEAILPGFSSLQAGHPVTAHIWRHGVLETINPPAEWRRWGMRVCRCRHRRTLQGL
jgi:hypothetical protein